MSRTLFSILIMTLLVLTGCAQIQQQNEQYPLNVNTQLLGNRIVVRVNSSETGPVHEAQVQVIDDIRRVIIDKPLNSQGLLRFRVPSLTTQLTVIVTDADGIQGKRILMGDDLRENNGNRLRWY